MESSLALLLRARNIFGKNRYSHTRFSRIIDIMSIENVKEQIKQKMSMAAGLNAKAKFDFGDDGVVFVDTTQNPPVISEEDGEADIVLITSLATFEGILNGTQDPNIAFMMGKLKVKGSMGLAMKLNSILED